MLNIEQIASVLMAGGSVYLDRGWNSCWINGLIWQNQKPIFLAQDIHGVDCQLDLNGDTYYRENCSW